MQKKGLLTRLPGFIDKCEVFILCLSVLLLAVLQIIDVIARNVAQSLSYTSEVSQFLMILLTFVGTSYGARRARHIRMGAIVDSFGPRLQKTVVVITHAVSALLMFIMSYYGYRHMMGIKKLAMLTPALLIPFWSFFVVVPVGLFVSGMHYVRAIIKNFREKEVWLSAEQQGEYEDEVITSNQEVGLKQ